MKSAKQRMNDEKELMRIGGKAQRKFDRVMGEFASGELKSHGKKVTEKDQALAIAYSEARKVYPQYEMKEGGKSKQYHEAYIYGSSSNKPKGNEYESKINAENSVKNLKDYMTDDKIYVKEKDGKYVIMIEEHMKEGGDTKWFKKAIEERAPYELGWSKDLSAGRRRAKALASRPKNWSKDKKYLSVARALTALHNVSQDAETKKLAKQDADYFFEKAKKTDNNKNKKEGGALNKFTDYYLIVNMDERGEYSASVYDPNDKSVFEIENAEQVREMQTDGVIKYKPDEDLDRLTQYLMNLNIIPNGSQIYSEEEFNDSVRDQYADEEIKEGGSMAHGGFISKGEKVWNKLTSSKRAEFLYENFTPEITPRSQEILVDKAYNFLPKNVKIKIEAKYANVEEGQYKGGGSTTVEATKRHFAKMKDYQKLAYEANQEGNREKEWKYIKLANKQKMLAREKMSRKLSNGGGR